MLGEKKKVLNTLKCAGLHTVLKALEKEVSEIYFVNKAKLTKVQFPQWRELMATAVVAAVSPVEGVREAVAARRSPFAFLLLAGQDYWGKPSQEGELLL